MPLKRLSELYWDVTQEEFLSLEEFLRRVKDGRYGTYPPEDIVSFLREVEANILANIDLKLEEAPQLAPLREDRIRETKQLIEDLITRYGRAWPAGARRWEAPP